MIQRYQPGTRMSQAVAAGGLLFTAGQVAKGADAKEQTQRILSALDALLEGAGTNKERVVSASIWLSNIERDFAALNEVWDAWVAPGHAPARATVGATLATSDYLVEIALIAALPQE